MKKIFFVLMTGCLPALAGLSEANAQSQINSGIQRPQKNVAESENAITPLKDYGIDVETINPKALRDFAKNYKNAIDESWGKNKDEFTVRFISDGVSNIVYYSTKGMWLGNVKSYSEDRLPRDIRGVVKSVYYDYSITYVSEVETIDSHGIPTYIIHLEDKNNIKLIRIREGEMETFKEYIKS